MTIAFDLLCSLVLEGGRRWGDAAAPEQRADAQAILDPGAQRRHWVSRARGWSKTVDAAGMTVAVMLSGELPAGPTAYAAAADRDQARLVTDAIAGFAQRTPGLAELLDVQSYKVIARTTGVTLEVLAADAASSFGLRPHWLVLDELTQWLDSRNARSFFEALSTALPKVTTSRAVIITTPGDPAHWSRAVYDAALAEPSWRVSVTEGPPPWTDPAEIEAERRRLPASAFERLWMGRWAASEDRLLNRDDVLACAVLDGCVAPVAGERYIGGVDLALRHDAAVVGIGHAEGRGEQTTVTIDSLDVFTPRKGVDIDMTAVEECILARHRRYANAPIVFDPAHAWSIMQRLRREQIFVVEHTFTPATNSRRALTLLELVRSHRLRLPNDPDLIDELSTLRLRETSPGVYRQDHDSGKHDDRATVVGLIADELLTRSATSIGEAYLEALIRRCANCGHANHFEAPICQACGVAMAAA